MRFYAHTSYIKNYGLLTHEKDIDAHRWVLPNENKAKIPADNLVYQSNQLMGCRAAILAGFGIGPMSTYIAQKHSKLRKVPLASLQVTQKNASWFVYHKALKKNAKVIHGIATLFTPALFNQIF